MGHERQRDVTVPPLPAPHLVVIQTALALGGLKADFDLPAPPGHLCQAPELGARPGRVDDVKGQLALVVGKRSGNHVPCAMFAFVLHTR